MPFDDNTVFLSSRFEEFAPLRRALRERFAEHDRRLGLVLVGLDDGAATHRPPLAESLERLRGARFMILLLGEAYGDAVDGQNKSYVNLEYEAALEAEGDIQVIAFGIGPSYVGGRIAHSNDLRMAAFQRQVHANHTLRFFDGSESVDEQAAAIYLQLIYAVCDLRTATSQFDDRVDDDVDPEDLAENEEIESLEQRYGNGRRAPANTLSAAEALAQPTELAAREQCREADAAIRLGALRIARDHLRRAVELRPLDVEANYRLARLYIVSGQRKCLGEAVERLDLVRRIFERDKQQYHVCDCLLLQARALIDRGDIEAALALAEKACAEVPGYGRARYEHARLLLLAGRPEAARRGLLGAVKRYFPLWSQALRDPRLGAIIALAQEDVSRWLQSHREITRSTLEIESRIAGEAGVSMPTPPVLEAVRSPSALARLTCDSIGRQYDIVVAAFLQESSAMKAIEAGSAESATRNLREEQELLQQKHGQFTAELASTRRSLSIVRAIVALSVLVVVGVLFAWSSLSRSPAFAVLYIAGIVALLLLPRLSSGPLREQQEELNQLDEQRKKTDAQLQEIVAARRQLDEAAQMARATLRRVFLSWRGSLLRKGRHQPFLEIDNLLEPGDLFVADRDELDKLRQSEGAEVVLQDLLAPELVGDQQHGRRLYSVVIAEEKLLVLSEAGAYSWEQG